MGPLTTLMYDAITSLIKASSGNKVPVEGEGGGLCTEGGKGGAASTRLMLRRDYRLIISVYSAGRWGRLPV